MNLILLASAVLAASPASVVDCQQLFDDSRTAMLQLDYEAFDQTEGSGFRALAQAGCTTHAADMIEHYMAATGATQSSLTWHIAQLRAESGATAAALIAARKVLREETGQEPFKWNDYVNAVIAFLEKDRAAFEMHLGRVSGAADLHQGNAMNAKLLRRLQSNFERNYLDAIKLGK